MGNKPWVAETNRKRTKHGATVGARDGETSKTYRLWTAIKQRCFNPNSQHFHRYGGRGITMCDEWRDNFESFYADVGDPPSQAHSLDRIDNDGNYEPNNVRWSTRREQANNRSTNVMVTHNGLTMNLKQWAAHLDWKYGLLASRWKKGLRGDELFAPPQYERGKLYTYKGKELTMPELAEATGIPYATLVWRYKSGKDLL